MQRLQASWRIYPNREMAEEVLAELLAGWEEEGWTYKVQMLNDGVRAVISAFDEDGEFVGNLP